MVAILLMFLNYMYDTSLFILPLDDRVDVEHKAHAILSIIGDDFKSA